MVWKRLLARGQRRVTILFGLYLFNQLDLTKLGFLLERVFLLATVIGCQVTWQLFWTLTANTPITTFARLSNRINFIYRLTVELAVFEHDPSIKAIATLLILVRLSADLMPGVLLFLVLNDKLQTNVLLAVPVNGSLTFLIGHLTNQVIICASSFLLLLRRKCIISTLDAGPFLLLSLGNLLQAVLNWARLLPVVN